MAAPRLRFSADAGHVRATTNGAEPPRSPLRRRGAGTNAPPPPAGRRTPRAFVQIRKAPPLRLVAVAPSSTGEPVDAFAGVGQRRPAVGELVVDRLGQRHAELLVRRHAV